MNEIQQELADVFAEILDAVGVPVTIAGASTVAGGPEPLCAALSQPDVVLEDDEAGFVKTADVRIKFLVAHLPVPLPTFKAPVAIDGASFAVTEVERKPGSPVILYTASPA